jgi:hypothetical protein
MHTQFHQKTCKELKSVGWMQMVDDTFRGQALVNTIINLPVTKETWNFLTSQEKVSEDGSALQSERVTTTKTQSRNANQYIKTSGFL